MGVEEGLTDLLYGPLYKLDCLGILKGSKCPHYDGESKRRPACKKMIAVNKMTPGYGVENGRGLTFH
ncbi:MAG: Type 1 glutamine amidotransferase-like domain-containing protein [Psychrobacillus psychrodurans]